jgi:pimeloyl-ACP methyl ester carboxylesterase
VIAPDLPGHGIDKTPIHEITLQAYTDRICEVLDEQSERVILVGHSMGGIAVTQAAEYRPEKIEKLVYLSAFLPQNGEFLVMLAGQDPEAVVMPNLIFSDDQSHITIKDEWLKEAFYGDCSDEDTEWAKSLLVLQATAPFATPVNTSEENYGTVRRFYISCLRDRAITPSAQKKMYKALPCEKVIFMDTSHSPFLSAPEKLTSHLLSL